MVADTVREPALERIIWSAADLAVPPPIIQAFPLAIYACDRQGRILWFNNKASALWGREPRRGVDGDRFCGTYGLYVDGRRISQEETPMARALRTGLPIHGAQGLIERPDGSMAGAMVHVEPVRGEGGEVVGAVACFHDITDRLQAEERLREQEQRLKATYENAPIGIAEVAADGRLQRVNVHLADLLGYPPQALKGRSIFDPGLTEDADEDRRQFLLQVQGALEDYTIEKRFVRSDGERLWISVTSSVVRDARGRFLYAVRTQYDITARKAAEKALVERVREQSVLFRFTSGLQRAQSLDDICGLALAAIIEGLACPRASILRLDAAGVMRFVADRGLSATYKAAVEGHSPWSPTDADPVPICIADVQAADLPEALKAAVADEGIGALAFIPICAGDRLLGKFMAYFDTPHDFVEAELRLAQTIARQLGQAFERLRIEEARGEAERAAQQLAALVASSHDAVISKDINGIITSWNDSAERLFGYRAEEVVGRSITLLIPPDRQDEEPRILARIRRGERVEHFETVRRRKDGSPIDISLTISPIRDERGSIIGASKVARDISDRVAAQARLRESERRLQELLAAIPAAIYTTDAEGRVTYFNEAAVAFAGRTPRIGEDRWCVTWKLYTPDGTFLPPDRCPMATALKEGRAIRNVEAVAERPDGVRVPFLPYPTPLRDESGVIVGGINMLVDISERKQAETQQRLLFNELNHRVKNNMQTLQALLHVAERKTSNGEARQILREARDRVGAMAAAQQVLYRTSSATHFPARDFLRAVCDAACAVYPQATDVVCEADDVELSNDAAMPLALLVNELLTNALKYGAGEDGVARIRISLKWDGDANRLIVEDSGEGFDLEAIRDRASGIKLVQRLARQLRGEFTVEKGRPFRCSVRFS